MITVKMISAFINEIAPYALHPLKNKRIFELIE